MSEQFLGSRNGNRNGKSSWSTLKSGILFKCCDIYVVVVVLLVVMLEHSAMGWTQRNANMIQTKACHVAQLHCQNKLGCGAAYGNYQKNCHDIQSGETTHCTDSCKKAVLSLLSTEDSHGLNLINCDCGDNAICAEQKKHMAVCDLNDLVKSINSIRDNHTIIDCNLAKWICEADTSCNAALSFVYQRCMRTFKGISCSPSCNNSLNILYSQQMAKKLRQCSCHGSEFIFGFGLECNEIKYYTEKLCYHQLHFVPTTTKKPQHTYRTISSATRLHKCNIGLLISLYVLLLSTLNS